MEGFRRVFDEHAGGARVRQVDVRDPQVVRGVSVKEFAATVRGSRFQAPERHGKWLIAPLSRPGGAAVLMHFGMTGSLRWAKPSEERHQHDRVVFALSDGELRYRDMRKLKGLHLVRSAEERDRTLGDLGPDALTVSAKEFCASLSGLRRHIKAALIDQEVIAGLGNLLVDEILWRARVHPRHRAADLDDKACSRLHARMRTVLRQAIPTGRVPPRKSWLTGRRDEPSGSCPRCGTTLSRERAGGRSTVFCPACQPDPHKS